MGWLYLTIGIVFEVAGTTSMKFSNGFSNLLPSVLIFVFYGLSFTALVFALKRIDLGVAYAVWAGVGTAIVAIIGVVAFKEPVSLLKIASIALIVVGVIGLHLVDQGGH